MRAILIFLCLSLPVLPAFAQGARYHVRQNAAGAGTGQSWADAFTGLHPALQIAQPGDSVWVAEGFYVPAIGPARDSSFVLPSGVRLFGGFAGTEAAIGQRDWAAHATVLSGDIGVPGDSTDNAYTILYLENPDSGTVVDGFTFRHGIANYTPLTVPSTSPRKCGGALYIMAADGWAYPDIVNCTFEQCYAYNSGGAVYVNGSGLGSVAPRFLNCVFRHNSARVDGGAVYKNGGSWVERAPDFGGCVFLSNRSDRRGGGLFINDSERLDSINILECQFIDNWADLHSGGANFALGRTTGGGSNLIIKGCKFENNAGSPGGAFSITSFNFLETALFLLDSCEIIKNKSSGSDNSGYAHVWFDAVGSSETLNTVRNCRFYDNENGNAFGSSFPYGMSIVERCMFFDNDTASQIYSLHRTRKDIFINNYINERVAFNCMNSSNDSSSIVANNVFIVPKARFLAPDNISSEIRFVNNLIVCKILIESSLNSNDNSLIKFINNAINLADSSDLPMSITGLSGGVQIFFENSYLDTYSYCNMFFPSSNVTLTCAPTNLYSLDPLFVAPDSGDYRLQPCSPLVNAGSNAYAFGLTDLAGQPRILGGTVDIGAYETAVPALAADPVVTPACPGTASGAAAFSFDGGCPPFDYAWASAGGGTGQGADGLVPGSYTFTITDARGSSFTATLAVPAGSPVTLAPAGTPVQCGDTLGGTAAVTAANALPPLQFLWEDLSTDSLLGPLPPGEYAVTVTDAIGCTASGTATVSIAGNLGVDVTVAEISCHGAADGSLTVLPANGLAPFSWLWAGGDTSATLAPVGPGDYTGALTDAFGCTIGWLIPLGQPDSLVFTAAVTPASGGGTADGSVLLDPITGGTQPFTIQWSNDDTGPLADSLPPGDHTMTLTDSRGCVLMQTFTVTAVGAQEKESGHFALFPNPARTGVWVVLPGPAPSDTRVRVLDATSRPVATSLLPAGMDRLLLPLGGLPAGIYAVWLENEREVGMKKLVIE